MSTDNVIDLLTVRYNQTKQLYRRSEQEFLDLVRAHKQILATKKQQRAQRLEDRITRTRMR